MARGEDYLRKNCAADDHEPLGNGMRQPWAATAIAARRLAPDQHIEDAALIVNANPAAVAAPIAHHVAWQPVIVRRRQNGLNRDVASECLSAWPRAIYKADARRR